MANWLRRIMAAGRRRLDDSALIREQVLRSRSLILTGVVCLLVVDALHLLLPLIMKAAIDALTAARPGNVILWCAACYLLVSLGEALCRYGWRTTLARAGIDAGFELRGRFVEKLLRLPQPALDRRPTGELLALASNDTESVSALFNSGIVILIDALFYLFGLPLAMFWLAPQLSVVVFVPLLVVPLLVVRNDRKIHSAFREVQAAFAGLTAQAQEALRGVRVVKGLAHEDRLVNRYQASGCQYVRHGMRLARTEAIFSASIDLAATSAMLLLLFLGGSKVIAGSLTIGTFLALQRYVQQLIWPVQALGLTVTIFQKGLASSLRLQGVLDERDERTHIGAPGAQPVAASISCRDLSFSYPDGTEALRGVTLEIAAGEWIALVGETGAGKSTFVDLIGAIHPAPRNTLFVGGYDVCDLDPAALRAQIAFVPQAAQLLALPVRDNLFLGINEQRQQVSEERLRAAAVAAEIAADIEALPAGYGATIGEHGCNLSGGQRQRLALARALIRSAPIIVIDDAFAALDMETESRVLAGLRREFSGRTVIIAGHRLSTARAADRIAVFQCGRIVQLGRHEELLRQDGSWYAEFVRQQLLEQELAHYLDSAGADRDG